MELVGLVVVLGAAIFIAMALPRKKMADWRRDEVEFDKMNRTLKKRFPNALIHLSEADRSFCIIDFDELLFVVGLGKPRKIGHVIQDPYNEIYRFDQLTKVEVKKNGETLVSKNRGSQAAGALLGGLAFGGIGAIIGGLSGSSTENETIDRITLVLKVRDNLQPVHTVTFFQSPSPTRGMPIRSDRVQDAIARVEIYAAHFENALSRPEVGAPSSSLPPMAVTEASLPDQIKDLLMLKDSGALSESEFASAKARVLRAE